MQKTVREILAMITNGELHFEQSTQRKFIYADMSAQLEGGETTKAGSLINSIIEKHIQLPAVYFWKNTDTNDLNIHDGKQRLLSIYYFINPQRGIHISTIRNNRETTWNGLSQEDQNYLLDYTFDIVYREGNSLEEEVSFDLINSNSVPLTPYECLLGRFYGQFLNSFENYINTLTRTYDYIKPINRGEQAYKLLLTCFGIDNDKQTSGNSRARQRLNDAIRPLRNTDFDPAEHNSFDRILILFNSIMKTISKIKEERALHIASFIVRNNYDSDSILSYYRECMTITNDISSWDMSTHDTFIRKFVNGLRLDPQRNFTKDIKDRLYARSPRCSHVNDDGTRCNETSYSRLEVDHIVPWSEGGRTILDNAQLLCKHHNTSKGAR